MISLQQIETDLTIALKARNQLEADTLRALKTRIQNEQISKGRTLEESELVGLVQSETKRRKEAAESFQGGGRAELADKELQEAVVLSRYLPTQADSATVAAKIDELISVHTWTQKDFGKAMAILKEHFGASSDGQTLARVLKEKLK